MPASLLRTMTTADCCFPARCIAELPLRYPRIPRTLSMMLCSMVLMVTGGSLMPSTQEPSQGAGHTRPVNSGKLLVTSSRSRASSQRPSYTSWFHSGILLPSGQPAAKHKLRT